MRTLWIGLVIVATASSSPADSRSDDAALATILPSQWTPEMLARYQHSPRYKSWLAATKFLVRAECEHRIPSYATEAGSKFEVDMGPLSDLHTPVYPISFTFRIMRPHDQTVYCYTVAKNSRFSPWHFADARKQVLPKLRVDR